MLAVFTVTSLDDAPVSAAGDAPGTLRQAIFDANNQAGADTIQFDAGLSGTIDLAILGNSAAGPSALLVTSEITIQGNAAGTTIRRDAAAGDMRLFRVAETGSLRLVTISLTGGRAKGPNDGEGRGGAIYNEGTLEIVASTLDSNRAIGGNAVSTGAAGAGLGGAIFSAGGIVLLENATLSGNIAQSGSGPSAPSSHGGGIYARNGSLSIYNSTITNSTASTGRGVYIVAMDGTATVEIDSSIIAQADAPVFAADVVLADGPGGEIFASGSNNLIRTQVGFPTVLKSDPLLGPLANNGGPTPTHALASNSPAINEGANPRSLATDQRGASYQRVAGGRADIGAFELQMVPGPILLGDYNGNSVVDAADYVIWRKTLGMQVALFAGADGSGNGEIDTADYDVWRGNFGASNPAAATGTARSVVASGVEILAAEEHSAKANAIMALPPPAFFQLPRSNGRIPVSLHQAATLRTSLLLNAALLDALTDASAADETSDESPRRPQHDSAAEAELTGDVRLVERIWKDWELLFDL